jgi:hypothetical protein
MMSRVVPRAALESVVFEGPAGALLSRTAEQQDLRDSVRGLVAGQDRMSLPLSEDGSDTR